MHYFGIFLGWILVAGFVLESLKYFIKIIYKKKLWSFQRIIIYIKNGKILASTDINSFLTQYKVLEFTDDELTDELKLKLIGCKKSKHGYSALIKATDIENNNLKMSVSDLESIMVHLEKE